MRKPDDIISLVQLSFIAELLAVLVLTVMSMIFVHATLAFILCKPSGQQIYSADRAQTRRA
jgi:hypothetical protein